jgi:hypothetical protein
MIDHIRSYRKSDKEQKTIKIEDKLEMKRDLNNSSIILKNILDELINIRKKLK